MRLLVLLATSFVATVLPAATSQPFPRPPLNILMIAVDDLNAYIEPMDGPAKTPHLQRLASESLLFNNAHCVVPACNPSRVALLTGLRPETTGQFQNEGNFRQARPENKNLLTLPQYLAASANYRTHAAGKIFHHPRGQGENPAPLSDPLSWQSQHNGPHGTGGSAAYLNADGFPKWHNADPEFIATLNGHTYAPKGLYWGPISETTEQTGDWKTADHCAELLAQKHDRPFFIACGIFRPHSPQLAPQKYFDLYPLESLKLPENPTDDFADVPAIAHRNWSTPVVDYMRKKDEMLKAYQAYLAATTFADDCIGHLLEALRNSPHADNTIVVLWGDHGFHIGDKNRFEKFSLWRGATRAPLIIKVPGEKPGVSERAVSFLDIYPTVCDLLGLPPPTTQKLEGTSLVPLLKNPAAPRTIPAIVTYPQGNHAAIRDHWQYIRYQDGTEELYDHRTDVKEFHNLLAKDRTPHADLIAELATYFPKNNFDRKNQRPGKPSADRE